MAGDDEAAPLASLKPEHFEPHVGETFRFEGRRQTLSLARVLREPGGAGGRPPFTLIFQGPRDGDPLPEGFYACRSDGGLRVDLYVSPIHTPAPDRQDYQAAFN